VSTDRAAPIGIFDSGVGGLTVARAVIDNLPAERIRYIGDTAHAPYGPLPIEQIRAHALAVADSLVDSGVKMLVIACNTAAAAGVRQLAQNRYDVPVLEVITPAVRRALVVSRSRRIGVIGTEATIASGAYRSAFVEQAVDDGMIDPVTVFDLACPSFVDFVERGITAGRQITGLAQAYLDPLQRHRVDTLVLGCTHYPLLAGVLQLVMGEQVTLVSSADETARDVFRVLTGRDLLADLPVPADPASFDAAAPDRPRHEFLATGDQDAFARLGRRFLGPEITASPW
jgi:glutamate racemase